MRSSNVSAERARRSSEAVVAAARESRLPHAVLLHGASLPALASLGLEVAALHLRAPVSSGHLDLHELRPAGKSRIIAVDFVREAVHFANLSSHSGRKVILVHEADRLNEASANTFLKTLEEPHPGMLILLLTTHAYRLLPTLVSRCARFGIGGESELLSHPGWRDWLATFDALLVRAGDRSRPVAAGPLMLAEAYGLLSRFEHCHTALAEKAAEADPIPDLTAVEDGEERAKLREAHESRIDRSIRAGMLAEMAEAVRVFARAHPGTASASAAALDALEEADHRAHRLNIQPLLAVEAALLQLLRRLSRA